MTAEEYLKQGNLKDALQTLQQQIRARPEHAEYRIFLFQLLAVSGQWDRALTQLNVIKDLDAAALAMVAMYKQVIACERFREAVFLGQNDPVILGQPVEWLALLQQSLKLTAEGKYATSQDLRNRAFELAPSVSGVINDTEFSWLADSDARLGPVLEVMVEGRYLWVPFERISKITIEPPTDLRDVVWLPAHFTWTNGGEYYGVIPTRYPESYQSEDPLLALSRKTVWDGYDEELFLGRGQKILTTDTEDYPLLDVRSIHFNAAPETTQETTGG